MSEATKEAIAKREQAKAERGNAAKAPKTSKKATDADKDEPKSDAAAA